jgi:hypothetical protein
MEYLALLLSFVTCAGMLMAVLLWRSFMPAYVAEKAKNLASKEDLAHLTRVVEGVKATHVAEIERFKADLASEAKAVERRRQVYEEICGAMRVFIAGHEQSAEAKSRFHSAYATAWLWASDDAVRELNRFIALQSLHSTDPTAVSQSQLKAAYVATVLAMRKDAGFNHTAIEAESYQFVQFS